jgi:hypothetical protein
LAGFVALPPIVVSNEGVVETTLSEPPDPTFRIGSLPAANKLLTTVGQDDALTKAVTKMLQFDYSQLPIMHGEREVKGMISWKSIASRYAVGGKCGTVQDCREDAQVVDGKGLNSASAIMAPYPSRSIQHTTAMGNGSTVDLPTRGCGFSPGFM